MSTLKVWLCVIVMAVAAVPLRAGSNEAKPAGGNTANGEAAAAAASPNPSPNLNAAAGNANVAALLAVLVKKGVLGSAEADAIRNAAPEAEFQIVGGSAQPEGDIERGGFVGCGESGNAAG